MILVISYSYVNISVTYDDDNMMILLKDEMMILLDDDNMMILFKDDLMIYCDMII